MSQPISNLAQLPTHARVWIYMAGRELNAPEEQAIAQALGAFTAQWASHGAALQAGYGILHHRFVVLAVDQEAQAPSGCSIDKSVHLLKALEEHLALPLLDRSQVAYRQASGQVATLPLGGLKAAVQSGALTPETPIFNTLVETCGQLSTAFEIPAAQSWLSRYFAKQNA